MSQNILIIDDDQRLRGLLEEYLGKKKFKIFLIDDFISAQEILEYFIFDLIIIDRMMPSGDGIDLIKIIKEKDNTPTILLTAMGETENVIKGLQFGADDYLSKPFEPQELLARIQSILRRVSASNSMIDLIDFEGLSVNKIKQEVLVDNKPVALSTAEMEALMLFVDNPNAPLSRDFLVENLRGIEWQTCDRSVDVLVSRLRNKLGESPSKTRFIITVHGVGYRFVGVKKNN